MSTASLQRGEGAREEPYSILLIVIIESFGVNNNHVSF
jgi:hypothetical protein